MSLTLKEYLIRVFERNYHRVYKFVYRRIGERELSEDISIDVFVEFIKFSKKRLAEDSEEIRKILFGIAKNLIRKFYETEFKRKFSSIDSEFKNLKDDKIPEDELLKKERLSIIAEILKTSENLKHQHKMCIFLHFFMGKSYSEIAKDLDLTISQVRSSIEYGKILLKKEVDKKMGVL